MTSVAWRRARRTEDLDPVTRADRDESRHVRRGLERRRQHLLACELADFVQEALEQEGLEADQGFRAVRLGDESVGTPLGPNANEPAGSDRRSSPT